MKPVIGITCKESPEMENYTNAVEEYGGKPILFASLDRTIPEHLASVPEYVEEIDGLLLPGGGDIDPCHFFQERHPSIKYVSRSRDALEIRLCQKTLKADKPVFGICRGIQVMNVAMNGSLYQDIKSVYSQDALTHPKTNGEDSRHEIEIKDGSLLSKIVGKSRDEVNSAHHQALDEIADEFVVTARSDDGIVEAVEDPSKQFVVGVQYHPERMLATAEFREHRQKLFEAFINAAAE